MLTKGAQITAFHTLRRKRSKFLDERGDELFHFGANVYLGHADNNKFYPRLVMENPKFILPAAWILTGLLLAGCGGAATNAGTSSDRSAAADTGHPHLEQVWVTDTSLRAPESALWDSAAHLFYVSDINGDGSAKDGNGFISQLGPDGHVLKLKWVTGLDAPKGLTRVGGTLYATDLDSLVIIDIATARVTSKVYVPGSSFLNDAVSDPAGYVYLSDTRQGKVFRYRDGKVSVLWGMPQMKGANGLLWWKDKLWILTSDGIYSYQTGPGGKPLLYSDAVKNGDGLAAVNDSDLIASVWKGEVYYVHGDGSGQKLLDTQGNHANTADISFLAEKQLVIVPTFNGNTVAAYRLVP